MAKITTNDNGVRFNYEQPAVASALSGVFTHVMNDKNGLYEYAPAAPKSIMALDINWCGADLGDGLEINTTGDLLNAIKNSSSAHYKPVNPNNTFVENGKAIKSISVDDNGHIVNVTYVDSGSGGSGTGATLKLVSDMASIIRTKSSTLQAIAAVGGSDNIVVIEGKTGNITPPTSLTLTYGLRDESVAAPKATVAGFDVSPTWTSSDISTVTVSGQTFTGKKAGSATLTARYTNSEIDVQASCLVTVTNAAATESITSGWTYTIEPSSVASIVGTTVTGIKAGNAQVKVNYSGMTCDLPGTLTVEKGTPDALTLSTNATTITRSRSTTVSSITAVGGSDEISLKVGESKDITAPSSVNVTYTLQDSTIDAPTVYYGESTVTATWTSNKPDVVEVSGQRFTGKKSGSATLTATYNGLSATCEVTVNNASATSSITSGWTYTISPTNVASISGTRVTGLATGQAQVKVNYQSKTCDLAGTITVSAGELTLSSATASITRTKSSTISSIAATGGSDSLTLKVGESKDITEPTSVTVTYALQDGTVNAPTVSYGGQTVTATWTSDKTDVVSVNGQQFIGKKAGTATLTASYNDMLATCQVTVSNASATSSISSGWTYTITPTNVASITGKTVKALAVGTANVKVNYQSFTCDLTGQITVSEGELTLSSATASITRSKSSTVSSIAATGGSDAISIKVGETKDITEPTSVTVTYALQDGTVNAPTVSYGGQTVTATWTSDKTDVVSVNGQQFVGKKAGTATLTATYNSLIATCQVTVSNASATSTINSGWTYTIEPSTIASITGKTVKGLAVGTANVKVNYQSKTCDLTGSITVAAAEVAPPADEKYYYAYAGFDKPTVDNIKELITKLYPKDKTGVPVNPAGCKVKVDDTQYTKDNPLMHWSDEDETNLYSPNNAKETYYLVYPETMGAYIYANNSNNGDDPGVFTNLGVFSIDGVNHKFRESVGKIPNIKIFYIAKL